MNNKVIVNGIDVLKDIEYKENLIKDLKDVVSKQHKLLKLYREKDKYVKVFTPLPKVELDKYRSIVKQIEELENE